MNRAERRAAARARQGWVGRYEIVTVHCTDCGAPFCPVCDEHTVKCECCDEFNCPACGYLVGRPASPFFDLSFN